MRRGAVTGVPAAVGRERSGFNRALLTVRLLLGALAFVAGEAGTAHAGLSERLQRGETVTVVVLGDSLAAGYELEDPGRDSYPCVFASVLQRRYPGARIRLVTAGIPGDTAWGGAGRFDRDVVPHEPDLVVIQFGGNDHFYQRPADEYRRDLEMMVGGCRRIGARVILAAPPIVSPDTDTPMVKAAKAAGRELGVPVADFDGALRRRGAGSRGPFPFGCHPRPYQHTVMARAVYEAFTALLPAQERLRVRLVEGVHVVPRAGEVAVAARVEAPRDTSVALILETEGKCQRQVLQPGHAEDAVVTFRVPIGPWVGRARAYRMLLTARAGTAFDYDRRWLSVAPVLEVGRGVADLGAPNLVVGARAWAGARDLGGRVRVTREADRLRLETTVTDDRLVRNDSAKDAFESDCVEVYLDVRPAAELGRPYWDQGVVCLFLRPGTAGNPEASWTSLDPLPEAWQALSVRSEPVEGGYRMDLVIPLSLLPHEDVAGARAIGFDVALDDADDTRGRRTQMTWAGGPEDFLDPSLYGMLDLGPAPEGGDRMRVCIR